MERAVVAPLLDGAPLGALRRVATSVSLERAREGDVHGIATRRRGVHSVV